MTAKKYKRTVTDDAIEAATDSRARKLIKTEMVAIDREHRANEAEIERLRQRNTQLSMWRHGMLSLKSKIEQRDKTSTPGKCRKCGTVDVRYMNNGDVHWLQCQCGNKGPMGSGKTALDRWNDAQRSDGE